MADEILGALNIQQTAKQDSIFFINHLGVLRKQHAFNVATAASDDKQLFYDGLMRNCHFPLFFQSLFTCLLMLGTLVHAGDPYKFPYAALHDLPSPLQEAYRNEKPNLGDVGRCAVTYDSNMDQGKMVFTCSIYVKMSAVAERKAMERCEQMRAGRGIKAPCKVIAE